MANILIIDDDPDFLDMLGLFLGRQGHQAVLVGNGVDGLERAKTDPPDLAIVDVMMPEMTGYDVCRQLRANPSTASLPILILTARGQPVDRKAALDAGANEHMSKPVTMADLAERINTMLPKSAAGEESGFKGTVALLSLRGGVGVTTLAVNLAAALMRAGEESVCLVDLSPSSGHAALQLGLRPTPNWLNLVQGGNYSEAAIEANLLQHASGLSVLASPIFPLLLGQQGMSLAAAQTLFATLQQRFAVIVVDVPPVLDEAAVLTLTVAKVVGLVVTAESPTIQTAVGTLGALKRWVTKFQVIINQVAPGTPVPPTAIERTLRRPVVGSIPFDPAQAQALTQGAPLSFQGPSSPLAQAVQVLAGELVQLAGEAA